MNEVIVYDFKEIVVTDKEWAVSSFFISLSLGIWTQFKITLFMESCGAFLFVGRCFNVSLKYSIRSHNLRIVISHLSNPANKLLLQY